MFSQGKARIVHFPVYFKNVSQFVLLHISFVLGRVLYARFFKGINFVNVHTIACYSQMTCPRVTIGPPAINRVLEFILFIDNV